MRDLIKLKTLGERDIRIGSRSQIGLGQRVVFNRFLSAVVLGDLGLKFIARSLMNDALHETNLGLNKLVAD